MKKKLLILAVLFVSIISVNAQSKSSDDFVFGGGINLGLPLGDFGDLTTFGIGIKLQAEKMFTDQVSGIASIGYTDFFGKTVTFDNGLGGTSSGKYPSFGLIPILVGGRYYFSPMFFAGVQIGLGIGTGGSGSSTGFDYLPQVGYNADAYQIVLGYNGVSQTGYTANHLDLSFVYKFGGGK
ncbi:MAG TPA: hypothetical protein VHZ50_11550 [Puia sp.]|jgi:hypothetical protein|nr:hypothetical protein [Puia sp.]